MPLSEILFVEDLAVVLIDGRAMAVVFRYIHQSALIGYLVAGMIIGTYTPPFPLIHNLDALDLLAEMGIVFLPFVGAPTVVTTILAPMIIRSAWRKEGAATGPPSPPSDRA
jgi:Kef-type K+ transport system membrane component KefB